MSATTGRYLQFAASRHSCLCHPMLSHPVSSRHDLRHVIACRASRPARLHLPTFVRYDCRRSTTSALMAVCIARFRYQQTIFEETRTWLADSCCLTTSLSKPGRVLQARQRTVYGICKITPSSASMSSSSICVTSVSESSSMSPVQALQQ